MKDTKQSNDDILGILGFLPPEKQKLYIQTLYSIAKTAIDTQYRELNVQDLHILSSLEDESDARFTEWIFR